MVILVTVVTKVIVVSVAIVGIVGFALLVLWWLDFAHWQQIIGSSSAEERKVSDKVSCWVVLDSYKNKQKLMMMKKDDLGNR